MIQTFCFFGVGKFSQLKSKSSQSASRTRGSKISLTCDTEIVLTFLELRKVLEHARDNFLDADDERFAVPPATRSLFRGLPHAVTNLQPWTVARESPAPASSPPPPSSSSSPTSSHPSPSSSQPPPALSTISSSTLDDDETADESFKVRTHHVAKHIEEYIERADPSRQLTQQQKSDRGFHIAMFQGDFWFVDH